jgi:hypothetical protein
MKEESMKKRKVVAEEDDPLDHEIDFSNAVPNPFARDFGRSPNVRILAPDLLEFFPDSHSMNQALRLLADVATRLAARGGEEVQVEISAQTATAPKPSKKKKASS